MKNKIKKQDIILVFALVLIAAVFLIVQFFASKKPVKWAEISVDGQVVEKLDLEKNTDITIHGYGGGTNHLIIQDGQIWCDEASCPDKVCVHAGKKSLSTDTIVCLPNKMIVRIVGD